MIWGVNLEIFNSVALSDFDMMFFILGFHRKPEIICSWLNYTSVVHNFWQADQMYILISVNEFPEIPPNSLDEVKELD